MRAEWLSEQLRKQGVHRRTRQTVVPLHPSLLFLSFCPRLAVLSAQKAFSCPFPHNLFFKAALSASPPSPPLLGWTSWTPAHPPWPLQAGLDDLAQCSPLSCPSLLLPSLLTLASFGRAPRGAVGTEPSVDLPPPQRGFSPLHEAGGLQSLKFPLFFTAFFELLQPPLNSHRS